MAQSEILSVRLNPRTRQVLAEVAATHDAIGASALARDILERWADEQTAERMKEAGKRISAYITEHPDGWDDDPAGFFPEAGRE